MDSQGKFWDRLSWLFFWVCLIGFLILFVYIGFLFAGILAF
jgi:uncharacterized membrane protein